MVSTRKSREAGTELVSLPQTPTPRKRASQKDSTDSPPEAKRVKPNTTDIVLQDVVKDIPERPKVAETVASKHIRFSSKSPPPAPTVAADSPARVEELVEEEESDDDAAPEDVSTKTAKIQSIAAREDTRKAVNAAKSARRQRRRNRDKLLREQAAGSEKRKEKHEEEEQKAEEIEEDEPAGPEPKGYSLANIPDLLPDDLLATEAPIRLPTPPPTSDSKHKNGKNLLLANGAYAPLKVRNEQTPKDLTVRGRNIRIVTQINPLLPPKAVANSKCVREKWMRGRAEAQTHISKAKTRAKGSSKWERRAIVKPGVF